MELVYSGDAFSRVDEGDDAGFYKVERMVSHIDAQARAVVEDLIGSLVIEPEPVVLDLMASWDSHLPPDLHPARVVGLGLNQSELEQNRVLDERVVHDLNRDPTLPFADASFDVVLNVVSIEYLVRPFEVMREVGRVLRPGGLVLIIFSDRMFPDKAIKIWRTSGEQERVMIVEDLVEVSGLFDATRQWAVKGLPRPAGDRYAALTPFADPVWAVAAERAGGPGWHRPFPVPPIPELYPPFEVDQRARRVGSTLRCPHCDHELRRWEVPQTPFTEWEGEAVYVCPSNECPFAVRGWQTMSRQGLPGVSYRFMYDPDRDRCGSVPISGLGDLSNDTG
jgi:SAM-dependent methyltransferase